MAVATAGNIARRILVVDDDPLVCDSIRQALEIDHHSVEMATSGPEGLTAFQKGKFDLVILDYEMPRMKGDKLAAAIKALAPQQPIIMITAYSESLRLTGNFPLPVDLVIGKPFNLQQFLKTVRDLTTPA